MIHPNYLIPLTDRIGQEFEVGDDVLVPVRNHRRPPWGAVLTRAKVKSIDPLYEKPGTWLPTGPDSKTPFARISQINSKKATEFYVPCERGEGYDGDPDLSKASVVSVEFPNGTTAILRYNDFVKVPNA